MYIRSLHIETERTKSFPYNTYAVRYAKHIDMGQAVTFIVGDNGVGKSTLIESIAYKLGLPRIDSYLDYMQESFEPIESLSECLQLELYNQGKVKGFFFRAEDFGDYVAKVDDYAKSWAYEYFKELPHSRMLEAVNNNTREYKNMMWNYGQKLSSFSHGEAFLHIITERTKKQGLYIFDEPESALSPIHQLSLIYLIREHLKREDSQFIIATHSPILMAMPGALIYEITETGMNATPLEQVEHYVVTKTFLNNPEAYFREEE